MGFGERLLELLQERSMSQKKFAAELHMAPTTLNGYVREQRQPDYQTLIWIAEYFQVTTDYLLGVTERRHHMEHALSVKEEGFLGMYRNIRPDRQDQLLEQLTFYHRQEAHRKAQDRPMRRKAPKQGSSGSE